MTASDIDAARAAFALSGAAWARHLLECPGAAFEGPGHDWFVEDDTLRIKAIRDLDTLKSAERHANAKPAAPSVEGAHPNGPVENCPCHLCRFAFDDTP